MTTSRTERIGSGTNLPWSSCVFVAKARSHAHTSALGKVEERIPVPEGRPSSHCPITPNLTPFSLPASNHATFCPNQVFVPESLYFLPAAAKSRVLSR